MLQGIAEIIILGLLADWVCRQAKLPGVVGMLAAGVALGPAGFGLLTPQFLTTSADLRQFALILILLRAGLAVPYGVLRQIGGTMALQATLPAMLEIALVVLLAPALLPLTQGEALLLGLVLTAASPAVVVPLMIRMQQQQRGTAHHTPTLILAATALGNVLAVVAYGLAAHLFQRPGTLLGELGMLPLGLLAGVAAGMVAGRLLQQLFIVYNPRATKRALIVIALAVLMVNAETLLAPYLPFTALLAAMTLGLTILARDEAMAHELAQKLSKIWIFAEIVVFALVGAQVDPRVALAAGGAGALLIAGMAVMRVLAARLCLIGGGFTRREKWFIAAAGLPKATVQAALGAAPLLLLAGTPRAAAGQVMLAVAVLSIVLTSPPGAWLLERLAPTDRLRT
ncbi:MAG TPA: cation:proton antiporter [bacterium]|nr:cation:proton antiporter [bacterium]